MGKKCVVALGVSIWLALSPVMVSDGAAQTITETDSRAHANKIKHECKSFVFTVNAYTKSCSECSASRRKSAKEVKRHRNIGTAIPLDNEGHLITLHSVVKNAEKVHVVTSTGKKVKARVVGSDYTGRISVLKIDDPHISIPPKTTSLKNIRSGNEVYFLGVVPGMSVAVSSGSIGTIRPSDGTIEVNTYGRPGTSGTPVFDKDKNVLGLLAFQIDTDKKTTSSESDQNTYLVISLEYASVLAHQVISNVEGKCGWLGLSIYFMPSEKDGVLVKDVIQDSPAYQIGIKSRDRIIEFNGMPISTSPQLCKAFMKTHAGDTVSLKILRQNKPISFSVTLAERPKSGSNR